MFGEKTCFYVETFKKDESGRVYSSDLKEATEKEVEVFKSKPCSHNTNADRLVYDVIMPIYNERFCGVCGKLIDFI